MYEPIYISTNGKLIRNITNEIKKISVLKQGKLLTEENFLFNNPEEIASKFFADLIKYGLRKGVKKTFHLPENKNIQLNNAVKEAYHKLIQES